MLILANKLSMGKEMSGRGPTNKVNNNFQRRRIKSKMALLRRLFIEMDGNEYLKDKPTKKVLPILNQKADLRTNLCAESFP